MKISLVFILTIVILIIALAIWEIIINKLSYIYPKGRILIYGAGKAGKILAERILEKCKYRNWDFSESEVIGFIDDNPNITNNLSFEFLENYKIPILGNYTKLNEIIKGYDISAVFIAIGNPDSGIKHMSEVIEICKKNKINCFHFNFRFNKLT